ncbi:TolC family protein [Legionella impletisoli]|uniref:Cobalt transporter n=1 Tax=Legionella impletisoli TaxID=343510 RepID=A0A917NER7_9GAMM|nr:TolC family protein [Legionella impletisoli]GGI90777.1 cobalt transporter [Legionella impletisoli]
MVVGVVRFMIILAIGLAANLVQAEGVLPFQEALRLTYQNNPELQAQIQDAEQARGQAIQDGLLLNPSLNLQVENLGGNGDAQGFETAETTMSVTQPLPLGGKRDWLQKASVARFEQMRMAILRKKAELYIIVGESYVNTYYATQWHKVTKKLVRLNEDIVNDIKRRQKAGASAELDLRLAEISLGEARIQQSKAYREVKKRIARLSQLLGKDLLPPQKLLDKGLPHHDINWEVIKTTRDKSIFIGEKTAELSAKRVAIISVKKDVWPTAQLQLGVRHFSLNNDNALVGSINSVMPVFDRNQGKILSAEAEYTQAMQNLRAARLSLDQKLTVAFLDLRQNSEEARRVQNSLLPSAQKASKLAIQGYQKGLYSYVELLNTMRILFEEERHYQEAHAKRDIAMIKIIGLLSKGSA